MISDITPVLLTYNEAANLARTLAGLSWAAEVVVVDSGSTDETLAIAAGFHNVRVVQRSFDTHAAQWNAATGESRSEWVLSLDADYALSDELIDELKTWRPDPQIDAYLCRFQYCLNGKPLRHGSLYPPRAVLYRRERCCYVQDGHTQSLQIPGATGWLEHVILHDDRKPVSRWLENQHGYAQLEARKLLSASPEGLSWCDRVRRRIVFAPVLVFFTVLLARGAIFDGWAGWAYAYQRLIAETILALHLLEQRHSRARQ